MAADVAVPQPALNTFKALVPDKEAEELAKIFVELDASSDNAEAIVSSF